MNYALLFLSPIFIVALLYILYPMIAAPSIGSPSSMSSVFECGIDTLGVARAPFSLKFVYLTIMFIIFDLEITIIILIPLMSNYYELLISGLMVLILTVGLLLEWKYKNLSWVN
uniref:NADH-ubiquinone oxidoreductase chain 3 n=1 Tax=Gordius sp. VVA-2019 TaxID=2586752 RepID=A0A514ABT8_9BILA|nr:NADH dehydrogenase subunit 3 [Gordius sp. VVA-2019]